MAVGVNGKELQVCLPSGQTLTSFFTAFSADTLQGLERRLRRVHGVWHVLSTVFNIRLTSMIEILVRSLQLLYSHLYIPQKRMS